MKSVKVNNDSHSIKVNTENKIALKQLKQSLEAKSLNDVITILRRGLSK